MILFLACGLVLGCSTEAPPSVAPDAPVIDRTTLEEAGATLLQISRHYPGEMVIATTTSPRIGADFRRSIPASDALSITLELNGRDITARAQIDSESVIYVPSEPLEAGAHLVRLRLSESSGAAVEESWSFVVGDRPVVFDLSPQEIQVPSDDVLISAGFADPKLAIDVNSIRLEVDSIDVSEFVELDMKAPTSGRLRYHPTIPLAPGRHRVELELANEEGFAVYEIWGFWVAKPAEQDLLLLYPEPNSAIQTARTRVGVRPVSNSAMSWEVSIQGRSAESANHRDGYLHYFAEVDLEPGDNPIEVIARFQDGSTVRRVFTFHRPIEPR